MLQKVPKVHDYSWKPLYNILEIKKIIATWPRSMCPGAPPEGASLGPHVV